MIPHRLLSQEVFGTGVRDRTAACRKRLRVIRAIHEAEVAGDRQEDLEERAISAPEVLDGYPALRKSALRTELCRASIDESACMSNRERVLPVPEQEAGIT